MHIGVGRYKGAAVVFHTFCTCPIGVQVGQNSLITDLLESLRGLVIDL